MQFNYTPLKHYNITSNQFNLHTHSKLNYERIHTLNEEKNTPCENPTLFR